MNQFLLGQVERVGRRIIYDFIFLWFFLRIFLFCGGLGFFVGGWEMIWIEDLFVMKSWIYSNIYFLILKEDGLNYLS